MTFSIRVAYHDADTDKRVYADLCIGGHLFGFAVSGPELWAAPMMFELGLERFIKFGQWGILEAEGAELNELERECRIVFDHVVEIRNSFVSFRPDKGTVGDHFTEDYILSRIHNLLAAIAKARALDGELSIG